MHLVVLLPWFTNCLEWSSINQPLNSLTRNDPLGWSKFSLVHYGQYFYHLFYLFILKNSQKKAEKSHFTPPILPLKYDKFTYCGGEA